MRVRLPAPATRRPTAAHGVCTALSALAMSLGALIGVAASDAHAAAATLLFEGVLQAQGGGPVADGAYELTFAIYAQKEAQSPVWSEGPAEVKVEAGRFVYALGSAKALPAAVLNALPAPHLGVQVAKEPELPRTPLHATLFALGAASLHCTGCVKVSQLLFDGDVDLGGNSLKAKNATFQGDVAAVGVVAQSISAQSVTAATFIGDGSKLTGIASPSGACKDSEAVIGIGKDGALLCGKVAGKAPTLGEVSGGLLGDEFTDVLAGEPEKVAIPDNTGAEAASTLAVPELGQALDLSLHIVLANTDLSSIAITLLPPDDKKVGWTICDPCGVKDAKALDLTVSPAKPPKIGDIGKWIGSNPKGSWVLKVKDTDFCVPQKPGNAPLCDAQAATDGHLTSWSMTIKTRSTTKVQASGALEVTTGLKLPVQAAPPVPCTAKTRGYTYVDSATDAVRICRKSGLWGTLSIHECGNGKLEPGETCDDANTQAGDGCDALCVKECGNGKLDGGEQCDPADPQTQANCTADCKKISYGKVWLESPDYTWHPVHYPHGTYKESLAVQVCKSVGLRLWRDEAGNKADADWAYDWSGIHNLGGHDICYKVNSATQGQQQSHTGTWMLFTGAWSTDMKLHAKAQNGQTVTVLNHRNHTGSDENNASWCQVTVNDGGASWQTQADSGVTSNTAVVLCAKGK